MVKSDNQHTYIAGSNLKCIPYRFFKIITLTKIRFFLKSKSNFQNILLSLSPIGFAFCRPATCNEKGTGVKIPDSTRCCKSR